MSERTSERQKRGIDGEAPRAKELKRARESADVDLDAHLKDVVGPTGRVSGGLQSSPARGIPDADREPMGRDDLTPITDPQHPEKAKNDKE